jgi:hypothetical protein
VILKHYVHHSIRKLSDQKAAIRSKQILNILKMCVLQLLI